MFDIFYNNTNGDLFDQTSFAQEGLKENNVLISEKMIVLNFINMPHS